MSDLASDSNISSILTTFEKNLKSVNTLVNFDHFLMDMIIDSIEKLHGRLRKHHHLDNPALTAEGTIKNLKQIRANDSLRIKYEEIFNLAVVLLVSYFGSTISDLFKASLTDRLNKKPLEKLLSEEIKFSIRELNESEFNLAETFPDFFVDKKDISFQDMQSIYRSFKDYLGIELIKNNHVNNIILAQACRNAIAHAGSLIDAKLMRQVTNAQPRDIKLEIKLNSKIQFSPEEIEVISASMKNYVENVCQIITTV